MSKQFGYITVAVKNGGAGMVIDGFTMRKVTQVRIEVADRFEYLGETYIVHKPRTEKPKGFVCSHEGLGFLVSETGTSNRSGDPVKNPNTYDTPEIAKEIAIHNIDNFIKTGADYKALLKSYRPLIIKTVGFLELRLRKIL